MLFGCFQLLYIYEDLKEMAIVEPVEEEDEDDFDGLDMADNSEAAAGEICVTSKRIGLCFLPLETNTHCSNYIIFLPLH